MEKSLTYNVYDLTNKKVSWVVKWINYNIDGATKFHRVGESPQGNDFTIEPSLIGLSSGETQQFLKECVDNDINQGREKLLLEVLCDKEDVERVLGKQSTHIFNDDTVDKNTVSTVLKDYIFAHENDDLVGMWLFTTKVFYILKDENKR